MRASIKELTCKTCAKFERDLDSKAGGWCPIPNKKDPLNRNKKYVYQSRKACLNYETYD